MRSSHTLVSKHENAHKLEKKPQRSIQQEITYIYMQEKSQSIVLHSKEVVIKFSQQ